jgi:hypothetical protein
MGPRVDSLSNYEVTGGQLVWAYGAGFTGAKRVTVGDTDATDLINYDDVTLGFTVPKQPGGSSNWVQVTGADGTTSPCEGSGQLLTYADEVIDPPRGEFRLDSVTPSPITAGRADSYWLQGSGLSAVSLVLIEDNNCSFETHDDTRLVFQVPEFRHDSSRPTATLRVHTATTSEDLAVECVTLADVLPSDAQPWVGHLDPIELPAEGGTLTLHGGALRDVLHVYVGNVEATIDELHDDQIVVTVGSLADYAYTGVQVSAVTERAGSPTDDLTKLRVRAPADQDA